MANKNSSKLNKVTRVDKNLKLKKSLTKPELLIQVKALLEINDGLEESNRMKVKLIENFQEKIDSLEIKLDNLSKVEVKGMDDQETQTENGYILKCEECNFIGETERELGWHMGKHHGWPSDQKSEDMDISENAPRNCMRCNYEAEDMYDLDAHTWSEHEEAEYYTIQCKFCDEAFHTLGDMMLHKKERHAVKVIDCRNFSIGQCSFGEDKCWFVHNNTIENFKCNMCDQTFHSRSDVMKHRKNMHLDCIQNCKNILDKGSCPYKNDCWYKHATSTEN